MEINQAKSAVAAAVAARSELLTGLSRDLFEHPELCFEEFHAHDVLTDLLASEGMEVERSAHGLDTAFRAQAGRDGPLVAVLCEYDALPGLGHACGHNVIAAAGIGAGMAAASVAEACGGRVLILGTPAEEGGGGKEYMIRDGALAGVDAAMMVHPADQDLDGFWAIAIQEVNVTFTGRAAHAAAAPQFGLNALDAAVLSYQGIAALRQHIGSSERIHAIFTDGGQKPNVVPERAAMQCYVRSPTVGSLEVLKERVTACIEAGAMATGCRPSIEWAEVTYSDLQTNRAMSEAYAVNAGELGRTVRPREEAPDFMGSTDMGNVSHHVPSIHPMIKVAPEGIAIHTHEFATHAGGMGGDRAVLDGAIAMAQTVVDLWLRPELLRSATAEFTAVGGAGSSGSTARSRP